MGESVERYQFGEFLFDVKTRELTLKGREVKLQAQPAALLGVLLARRDEVVSREELKSAIWGSETHVDFEKGLNFCIGQVRAALRDDASRPVFIRTFPKLGYQFIAPVTVIAAPAEAVSESVPVSRRSLLRPWVYGLAAVVFAAGLAVVSVRAKSSNAANVAVVRFDAETGAPAALMLAEELTADVTVRLTAASGGGYRVIGNAAMLREAREQRDLRAIASSLHCEYAVLGQVWAEGDRILVLAHLIRLSDQTHIWVVRLERKTGDPGAVESEAAAEIASQFAASLHDRPGKAASYRAAIR